MGFNWFWRRVSDEWIASAPAAGLFGLAAALICLLTAYLLGVITIREIGIAGNLTGAAVGVSGVLSIPFLWGGMCKYQDLRNKGTSGKTIAIRIAMLVGLWYAAIVYFLLVYLPTRTETENAMSFFTVQEPHKEGRDLKAFRNILCAGWLSLAVFVVCEFAFPKLMSKLLHPVVLYIQIVPLCLLFFSFIYLIARFLKGRSRQ